MIARLVAALGALSTLAALGPARIPAAAADPPTLVLVDQTFVVPGLDTTAENGLSITVGGSALSPVCNAADDELSIVSYRPVTTRAQADDAIDQPGSAVDRVSVSLCGVTPSGNGNLQVVLPTTPNVEDPASPAAAATLRLPEGVVPIGVEVRRGGTTTAALITFVDRLDTGLDAATASDTERMKVAVAVSVDGGPTLQPDGSVQVTVADQGAVDELTGLVRQIGEAPLTISIRPELLQGLSQSGSPLVAALRDAVTTNAHVDVLAVPYVGMDPTAAARADLGNTFLTQFTLGAQVLSQLLGIAPSRAVWFVPQALGDDGAQLLAQAAVGLVALLPPAAFSLSPSDRQFLVPLPTGTLAATPVDRDIAALLDDPGADPTLTAYQLAAQVLLMRTEALNATQGIAPLADHNMILSTTDGTMGNPTTTAKLVTLLAQTPQLALATASKIGEIPHPILTNDGSPYEEPPPDVDVADLGPLRDDLASVTADVDATASMLPGADPRPSSWRSRIEVMPSFALDDGERDEYVTALTADTAAIRAAVEPPGTRRFTLGGRHSTLRLSLRNDGDTDLTVRLIVQSSKLAIDEPNRLVPLPAGETTVVEIPVDARTNGEFPVEVRTLTPEGNVEVVPPVIMTARVNALTGLGQLATGAFVLVLLTWWAHHFRQRRRRAAAAAAAATP